MKIPSPDAPGQAEIPEAPEEAAKYIEKYLDPRDKSISDITDALQGRLSPKDNLNYERRTVYLSQNSKTKIQLGRVKNPAEVCVEWAEQDDYYKFKWAPTNQDEVEVAIKFDTDPNVLTLVHLGIWGD